MSQISTFKAHPTETLADDRGAWQGCLCCIAGAVLVRALSCSDLEWRELSQCSCCCCRGFFKGRVFKEGVQKVDVRGPAHKALVSEAADPLHCLLHCQGWYDADSALMAFG